MQSVKELANLANDFRITILEMLTEAKSGHPGGSLSAIDVLTALWFSEMKGVESAAQTTEDRDRFVLSKGHGVPALYAILAKKGFFPSAELMKLRKTGALLQGHPDRVRLPILEASTGSLGQGLSVSQGLALAQKLQADAGKGPLRRTYCLMGDGEIQEGQVWEAALSCAKYELSHLCAIVDANGGQIDGPVEKVMPLEPMAEKWKSFGWEVVEINGHDFTEILKSFEKFNQHQKSNSKKPFLIITRTVKGKGVSFMEGKIEWHGVVPNKEQRDAAIAELKGKSHV
jgi:transketolase